MARSWDTIKASERAKNPHPLLAFAADLTTITNANLASTSPDACKKPVLSLAVGDPALDGNLPAPSMLMDALGRNTQTVHTNGYTPSHGLAKTRQAVADYWYHYFISHDAQPVNPLSQDDVLLASGCSDALSIAFGALASAGELILLPQPFFAQYSMTAAHYGIDTAFYTLLPEKKWEVDLVGLEQLVQSTRAQGKVIRAILLNNPCNPCGSNWSRAHVGDIVRLCERLQLPIVSDEIYAGMVFDIHESTGADGSSAAVPPARFTSVADIAGTSCVRFITGGASKRFSVPGERFGWVLRLDEGNGARAAAIAAGVPAAEAAAAAHHPSQAVLDGMVKLCARYLIPQTTLQVAMAECLTTHNAQEDAYFERTRCVLRDNAKYLYEELRKIHGLRPIEPQGGMFASLLFSPHDFDATVQNGVDFANALAREDNVHVFPGEPFRMPNAVRLVLSRPPELNHEVIARLHDFCERHRAQ